MANDTAANDNGSAPAMSAAEAETERHMDPTDRVHADLQRRIEVCRGALIAEAENLHCPRCSARVTTDWIPPRLLTDAVRGPLDLETSRAVQLGLMSLIDDGTFEQHDVNFHVRFNEERRAQLEEGNVHDGRWETGMAGWWVHTPDGLGKIISYDPATSSVAVALDGALGRHVYPWARVLPATVTQE